MLRFLKFAVKALTFSALALLLFLVLIASSRYFAYDQADDEDRVAQKLAYLQQLSELNIDLSSKPNIIVILYDDLGLGDIGANDHAIRTPNLDALANNGITLSHYYSPSPVCTPSRAGLLTGRLAPRAGLPNVVFPDGSFKQFLSRVLSSDAENERLPFEEITLAEILKASGYKTGMIGKWHLGDKAPSLPNQMGFDHFYGALYSNDMEPFALYRNEEVAEPAPVDQRKLTELYTGEAVSFVERDSEPFFLYFAHNYPHIPLAVPAQKSGRSNAGLYGDVMEEIDDGIGRLVHSLRVADQLDNTLIIVTSDNGPWYQGSAGNVRGRKGTTFEGGMRVPFFVHWPERITQQSSSSEIAMGTDLVPTVLDLLQIPAPADRHLDGKTILPLLVEGAASPHDYLYYYAGNQLIAVRDGRFKYRKPHGVIYAVDQIPFGLAAPQKEWLIDFSSDPREAYDVSSRYPNELSRLRAAFEAREAEMLSNPRGWVNVAINSQNSSANDALKTRR